MNPARKIRVLVVDDSALVRKSISTILSQDPELEVVGAAADPYVARDMILALSPDVLTLDIEMPRMDGLTFLRILQQHRPLPVVVVSSLTQSGSRAALEALEAGAVDVLAKPSSSMSVGALAGELAYRVKGAALARRPPTPVCARPAPRPLAPAPGKVDPRQLIVIGASTGGVEALRFLLPQLPDALPPIAIVQHIPAYFSGMVAERLNALCPFEVREAVDGDLLRPGLALLAPGGSHLVLSWHGAGYRARLTQSPPIHFCRPSVDVLFRSVTGGPGAHVLAMLLTGMGSDGAEGMLALKAAGARTLAQDEASCVVYGMPRAAAQLGAVDQIVPLAQMPQAVLQRFHAGGCAEQTGIRAHPPEPRQEGRLPPPRGEDRRARLPAGSGPGTRPDWR